MVGDRYSLARPIGAGGMGRVWQGIDARLDREVAVKVVKPDLLHGPGREEIVARFGREARVTARISHPGIPAIFDAGVDEDGDELYLVMEYLPGLSLRDLLDETGPFPTDWAVAVGAQLASVLAAAHAAGVVHRDLKPANIIVGLSGLVSVVDFGIASILEPDVTQLTATGDKPGTVNYMAPEQILAKPVGPSSDLYSLGALLYEMTTGERLFASHSSAYEVQTAHLTEIPEPVRRRHPEVPSELDSLIASLLSKEPERRPSSASEVFLQLARLFGQVPVSGAAAHDSGDPTWPLRAPLAPPDVAAAAGRTSPAPAPRGATGRLEEAEWAFSSGDFHGALTAYRSLTADFEAAEPARGLHCQVRAAQCLAALGNASSALAGLGAVIERQRRLLGERHRDTLRSRRIAVDMLVALGRGGEAHQSLAALVKDMAAALGPAEPDTIEAERLLRAWAIPPQAGPVWPVQATSATGSPR